MNPAEGVLLPKETVSIKLTMKNMDDFNIQDDKVFVRATSIEYDISRKVDAKKIWRDGMFLDNKVIEEKNLIAKIHKDIMKFKSPKKSHAK